MAYQNDLIYATYASLAGQRVVITGGGTGIGAELVRAFAFQGAQVFFIDIAEDASRALERALSAAPIQPVFVPCNLMDLDALSIAIAGIEQRSGAVQILINNAANDDRHKISEVSAKYYDDRMAVNLRHVFFCSQAVAPGMAAAGGGVILNFGSISWHRALPNMTLYETAKAAIEGMTRGLARDLGQHGIRVNCIIPGAVRTPRQEALWSSEAEAAVIIEAQCIHEQIEVQDVAALALFLASDNARRCSGRDYFIDAGWHS